MNRIFNVTGACNPQFHYMVDIQDNLKEIKKLVDSGAYFTINRARQYGKTTTLNALAEYLQHEYVVVQLDFQLISASDFASEETFVNAFADVFLEAIQKPCSDSKSPFYQALNALYNALAEGDLRVMRSLFTHLKRICAASPMPVVLMIDEADRAANNQVFIDFLAQLRGYYLKRPNTSTFHSVILAGVYDVRHIQKKIRSDEEHQMNSPWNIATDFTVNMNFSAAQIQGMLEEYEADHNTGMNTEKIAGLIFDSTSGYPFLVSRICKLIDETICGTEQFPDLASAWTEAGYIEAEKLLIHEKNTLFDSLTGKLANYPDLKRLISMILFEGKTFSYTIGNDNIEIASMLGFIKNKNNTIAISNRIFEMVLYAQLLSEEEMNNALYTSALSDKNQFIRNGRLDMRLILERFVIAFTELYKDESDTFKEEIGRKYFMLFLKPIINGTGHSYIEARTRNMRRTDIIVDYKGEQFIVELKIWRGPKYHADGEQQVADYLDYYGLTTGYMLIFNFNQDKEIGVTEKRFGDRILIEATV